MQHLQRALRKHRIWQKALLPRRSKQKAFLSSCSTPLFRICIMPQINGDEVGNIGFGLMGSAPEQTSFGTAADILLGLTLRPIPEDQAFAAMRTALANGCNAWNGGEFYGPPERNSLTLLNKYFEKYPEDMEKVSLNIKGCVVPVLTPDGSREGVRRSVETCVAMLGAKKKLDVFEPARKDPKVPFEETLGALVELAEEGKMGGVGLSEVSAKSIREAARTTKVASVEIELSLWQTEPLTNGILAACKELDIPVLACVCF